MLRLLIAGSCLVGVSLSLPTVEARSPRRVNTANLAGTWDSTYGEVSLTQRGDRISGQYPCCGGGTLEGRIVEGSMVKFHWKEPRGAGEGEGLWRIQRDGSLDGSWGLGQSASDGGVWKLWRARQIAQ